MSRADSKPLTIAVRVYPESVTTEQTTRKNEFVSCPNAMLVFDTETRTDGTQRLMFGSYQFVVNGKCLEEGLFYADDLSAMERRIIEQYVATHEATGVSPPRKLRLLTLPQFRERVYRDIYKSRCLLVGFNLPFDVARLAYDVTDARGRFAGGFSFGLWTYMDKIGVQHANQYRPRIGVKHIDGKRALKGFTARNSPDRDDLIPEGSRDGEPEPGYKFRGHFLDLRTLAFALTDRGYSLDTACEAFGVEHGKQHAAHHGAITEQYIDYNRRDVLATSELAIKLLAEYEKHPIALHPLRHIHPPQ